jgi:hypothetical protein
LAFTPGKYTQELAHTNIYGMRCTSATALFKATSHLEVPPVDQTSVQNVVLGAIPFYSTLEEFKKLVSSSPREYYCTTDRGRPAGTNLS